VAGVAGVAGVSLGVAGVAGVSVGVAGVSVGVADGVPPPPLLATLGGLQLVETLAVAADKV